MTDPSRGQVLVGDALKTLRKMPSESVHCVVTSPPYWNLRDYGVAGQLGLEATPQKYVRALVKIMREVRRVLRSDGTCWVNLGDSYMGGVGKSTITSKRNHDAVKAARIAIAGMGGPRHRKAPGLKEKDLCGIPWRVALAMQADGWWLRSDVIWHKPSPLPESVRDRPSRAHEYVFLFTKSAQYSYDAKAISEPLLHPEKSLPRDMSRAFSRRRLTAVDHDQAEYSSRETEAPTTKNARTVWTIAQTPFPDAHFATFPSKLVEPCVLAGCPRGGIVLDPFAGSGTTLAVALEHGRQAIGIELNPDYAVMIERRLSRAQYPLPEVV